MWGNAVTYDKGKVLLVGGSDRTVNPPSTNHVYRWILNGPAPLVTPAASMAFARAYHNSVTLPTGEVIAIGGNTSGELFSDNGAVYDAEIYTPETDTWRTVGAMFVPRNYHSIALLLQDGRVLSAGGGACGGGCGANHRDGQIYSPPYLFASDGSLAPRPEITAAPALAEAGTEIGVIATGQIAKFSMVRISATTHAMNTDQRHLPVAFTDHGDGSYTLALEPNPNVLLPGYYWIFAIDTAGVPSVGHTFQVVRDDGGPHDGLEVEAETAVLSGNFAVTTDAEARAGRYISVETGDSVTAGPTSPSRALLAFDVAEAGLYRIDAGVSGASETQSSFFVRVDDLPSGAYLWDTPASPGFVIDSVSDGAVDPVIVSLGVGPHTVEVIHRETGSRLDWMKLVYVGPPRRRATATATVCPTTRTRSRTTPPSGPTATATVSATTGTRSRPIRRRRCPSTASRRSRSSRSTRRR
jgi:hypothetical protein